MAQTPKYTRIVSTNATASTGLAINGSGSVGGTLQVSTDTLNWNTVTNWSIPSCEEQIANLTDVLPGTVIKWMLLNRSSNYIVYLNPTPDGLDADTKRDMFKRLLSATKDNRNALIKEMILRGYI